MSGVDHGSMGGMDHGGMGGMGSMGGMSMGDMPMMDMCRHGPQRRRIRRFLANDRTLDDPR